MASFYDARGLSPEVVRGQETRPFVNGRPWRPRRYTTKMANLIVVFRVPRGKPPHPIRRWVGGHLELGFLRANIMTRCWNREVRRTGH